MPGMTLRDIVKGGLEAGIMATGVPARRIRRRASGTVILSYHNVVPTGEQAVGDLSLHIGQRRFGEHLDRLLETHDVVPLSELRVGQVAEGRPRAVVTFDDAYLGTITAGFDELSRRGLPGTVFVPPGCLGSDGFWWDRIASPHEGLGPEVRSHALEALGGKGEQILAWARGEGMTLAELPGHARPATRDELLAAARSGRFELGSHTWSHVNLAGVAASEALDEMSRGHAWLDDVDAAIPCVDWLAYPYGLYSAEVVAAAAQTVGHAVRVDGGAAEVGGSWTADAHRLPRINVPAGLSPHGLVLRLAGLR
jgi:peptidoglycan/xylan/chitin deacetylase (PgdA/CDA1 family)